MGIIVDLAAEIGKRLSLPATLKIVPAKRVVMSALDGDVHVIGLYNPQYLLDPKEKDLLGWSIPVTTHRNVLVTLKEHPITTFDDLNGLRIGTRLGFVYPALQKKFDKGEAFREDVTTADRENFKKLVAHRIDALVASAQIIAQHLMHAYPEFGAQCVISPLQIADDLPMSFALSPKSPVLVEQFNQILETLKADGTLRRIFEKYGVSEF